MHYRNGREAKPGDHVLWVNPHGPAQAGVLHSANPGAETCNARIATARPDDPYVTVSDCVHVDDVKDAIPAAPKKA